MYMYTIYIHVHVHVVYNLFSAIKCEEELIVTNGTITYTNENYNGSVATFTCNPGLTLMGEVMATCMENGKWSTNAPHCVGM